MMHIWINRLQGRDNMLQVAANIGILLVALLHCWFCILEIYFWRRPLGIKLFRLNQEFANQSAVLAANQGIYNAFLAAGLIWGFISTDSSQAFNIKIFFLSCVIVAGVFAGITANKRIFYIQAIPAAITLALLMI